MHRTMGYSVALLALGVAFGMRSAGAAGRPAALVLAGVFVQVALGITNILALRPVPVTLAHSGTAALLVLATTWLLHSLTYGPVVVGRATALRAPASLEVA